jgi:fumarate reductase subunit C
VRFSSSASDRGRNRSLWTRTAVAVTAAAVLVVTATGCSQSEGSDAERFCGEVAADPVALVSPLITDEAQLIETIAHYEMLIQLAPIDIESELMRILLAIEAAASVDPNDDETLQIAALTAYASESAAVRVAEWVKTWCGVDIGPVTTITPHGPAVIPQPSTGTAPAR